MNTKALLVEEAKLCVQDSFIMVMIRLLVSILI